MGNVTIYPKGTADITVPAGQSIAISNFGGGIAQIYYLITAANAPPAFQFQQILENSSVTLGAFSAETIVRIEANNSKVIYDVGASPDTGIGDADTLGGQLPAYYQNADNINAGTLADARLPGSISSDITGNAATATNSSAVGGVGITNLAQLDQVNIFTTSQKISRSTNANLSINVTDAAFYSQILFELADATQGKISYNHDNTDANETLEISVGGASNRVMTLKGNGTLYQGSTNTIWHAGNNPSVGAGNGISGSFTTVDGKTVTVTNGIITAIV